MDALLPGDPQWVGPYRLDGRLGAGGMGQVYLATSPGGRKVAVKLIRPELAATPQFRVRFAREVDAARQVGGFHTAQVVDADPEASAPWLVTAYIHGPTLQQVVAQRGPLAPEEVRRLGAGLAEGLAAIHGCGLVHRDLKPGNVIIAEDGPRIIDFGIARAVDASSLTATGSVIGTYAYMSPEQIRADRAGPASDVFALGSVVAFAATGRSPFDAPTLLTVVQRILDEPPALDGVDGRLRSLLDSCLAKDPADRPSVSDLPARFVDDAGSGTAVVPPPRPEPTVALTPARHAPAPPRAEQPRPATVRDPGVRGGADADADPYAATRTGPVPAAPAAPAAPVPSAPEPSAPEPATARVSRRTLLFGGLAAAAAAGVGVPLLLNRDDGNSLEGPSGITALSFSPDGKTLAASSTDGKIWRWDLSTRQSTVTRVETPKYMQATVFSRDLALLVRAEENKVQLWDVGTGRSVATFTGAPTGPAQEGFLHSVGLSPDGKTVAASSREGLYVWDVPSGRAPTVHEDAKSGPAAFSPDGGLLVGGFPVQVRQLPADQLVATVSGGQNEDARLAVFSPDGQILALAQVDYTVRLWNAGSRQDLASLDRHGTEILALAFHPGGRLLASADSDGKTFLWDTASGSTTATFTGDGEVAAVAFSPDGKTLAAGLSGGTVHLWPVQGP
ncbi:serine/threonine protein kinase [Streptomyces sp. NBC_00335]|uniref:WD40 repeat domain-containing serine/threonine protein kinase n=1 Tax=unclassified Streptomyces TaxID=2593676 RepID=UPI002255AB8D|nr:MULTISPECIES: serine/threonine-protein kinase [unclassified Streptomyces]MCX5406697.1 serine/threonine protein kinase [Streptomyces sp. NBC_00086]